MGLSGASVRVAAGHPADNAALLRVEAAGGRGMTSAVTAGAAPCLWAESLTAERRGVWVGVCGRGCDYGVGTRRVSSSNRFWTTGLRAESTYSTLMMVITGVMM